MGRGRRNNRGHHENSEKKSSGKVSNYLKKFLFWFVVYFISIIILNLICENTKIYQAKIGFYLIAGFVLVIVSRVVYSAKKRKRFNFGGIILWGLIYSVVFGLVTFILGKPPQVQINPDYDKYIATIIFSAIFTVLIMFFRRMKLGSLRLWKGNILRAPSQIFTGIALIVLGILCWRFSGIIFLDWFNWVEGMAWSWLIGLGLIIAGFLVLVAWWRNNVSMFTTKHNVNWHH